MVSLRESFPPARSLVCYFSAAARLTTRSTSRGLFVYTALNGMIWTVMFLSRGAYEPKDYHRREYWTWKPAGEKPWIFRMFTKGRFWEDERRKKRRSEEENNRKQACTEFAMSDVDLDSMRTSRVATSSFAASSQRISAVASEGTGPHGMEEMDREGELHELEVVVVPQQTHVGQAC